MLERGSLALCLVCAGASGCLPCPERECVNQLLIQFPTSAVFEPGTYVFRVTPVGGTEVVCEGTAPLRCTEDPNDPDIGLNSGGLPCSQPSSFLNFTACETVCGNPECTTGEGRQSFDSISILQDPPAVRLQIERDGTTIVDTSSAVDNYTTSRPNGEGCSPVCRFGSTDVSL